MKFICLISAEKMMEHLSEADAAALFQDYAVFTERIKASGQFVAANRLLPPETATTLRVRDGKVQITDGPFAETKEMLGGYYVIDAVDLNAAIALAAHIPGARFGCVEVRAIADDAPTRALGFDRPAQVSNRKMSFQAYLDNIHAKTGKTPEDFKNMAAQAGIFSPSMKAGDLVDWLKQEFDLGHGHSMAVWAVFNDRGWVESPKDKK
ncbi:MAG: DUF4287 domain-containing protein [Pseudomonadota bacterium]